RGSIYLPYGMLRPGNDARVPAHLDFKQKAKAYSEIRCKSAYANSVVNDLSHSRAWFALFTE
ncbi:MAG TPA: hypothetical protein VJ577_20460, partial [Burkholderiaceae bacterium]|nr:hypothetical protein [Burkholderiaceae bacterium]